MEFCGHLETAWNYEYTEFAGYLKTIISTEFCSYLTMPWTAAQEYRSHLLMPFRDAFVAHNHLEMTWKTAHAYHQPLEMVWQTRQDYVNHLQMAFGVVADAEAVNHLEMVFPVLARDEYLEHLQMLWFGGGTDIDQQYGVTVTMAGVVIDASEIRISRRRDTYVIAAALAMAGDPALLPGAVLPRDYAYLGAAEQSAARTGATVIISIAVAGEIETVTLLATELTDSKDVNGYDYTLTCESPAVLMDAPYSLPVSGEYGRAMASVIAGELTAGLPIALSWSGVDWYIPRGVLYANGETRLEVLRKLTSAVGARIESDQDGNITVRPYYDISRKDWGKVNPDGYINLGDTAFRHGRTLLEREDCNSIIVGDEAAAGASLTFAEEDLDYGIKIIKAYEVPWTNVNPGLETSGPDRVIIESGRVVWETVEREQIEIVEGAGTARHPIYEVISRSYGDNRELGAISYSEDGAVTTEVKGQSLVYLTYKTKYWQWRVKDKVSEAVQLYALPAWADAPVTIVVTFGDAAAAQGFVVVEPDEMLNVDGEGKHISELPPSQPFYFLLQHDASLVLDNVAISSGAVTGLGRVNREKEQLLQFVDQSAVQLPYIPDGDLAVEWYGRSPRLQVAGREIKAAAYPAIGEVSYNARMESYRVTPPQMSLAAEKKYYILITVKMVSKK